MSIKLRQSTASQEVVLGTFLDDTTGKDAETTLSIANTDIKIWKSGTTTLVNKTSGGATHISGGNYYIVLDATDTNTVGPMEIYVHVAGALPIRKELEIVDAHIYDTMVAGTDKLEVDVLELGGSIQSATDLKDFADAGYDPATNKVEGVKLVDTTTANTDMRGTDSAALASVCTEARLAGLDAANIPTDLANILADTAEIGVAGANLTALAAQSTVDAILADTGTTLENHLTDIKGATFSGATDSLEAIRDRGDTAWTTGAGGSSPTVEQIRTEMDTNSTQLAKLGTPTTTIAGDIDSLKGLIIAEGAVTDPTPTLTSFLTNLPNTNDDFYNDAVIVVKGQARIITGYNGLTKQVTLNKALTTVGDTHPFVILAGYTYPINQIQNGLATEAKQDIIDTNVDAILVDTSTTLEGHLTDIKGATFSGTTDSLEAIRDRGDAAWLTGAGGSSPTVEQIRAEIDTNSTQLAKLGTPAVDLAADIAAVKTDTGTTLEGHLTDIKGGTFSGLTDSLEAIRDRGDAAWVTGGGSAPTASEVADAVWDEVLTPHNGAGSAGLALTTSADGIAIDIPATLGSPVTTIAGDIATMDANVDSILDDTGTSGVVLANSAITAAKVAANALTNGAFTNGYFNAVNAEVDTALADYDAATGAELAAVDTKIDTIDTKVNTIDANVDAVLVDTGTTLPATLSSIQGPTFNGLTDSLEAIRDRGDTDWTTGADAPTAAQIRTEIDANSTQLSAIIADVGALPDVGQIQVGLATEAKQDLIKAKTDDLTFTKANELDTNTQSINGSTVIGDGKLTPWEGT